MVRQTVKAYTTKLPAPGPGVRAKKEVRGEEDLAGEILDLKKALNTARQDLMVEKVGEGGRVVNLVSR